MLSPGSRSPPRPEIRLRDGRSMRSAVDPEAAVEYGVFSRDQALAAGYSTREVARHLRSGCWLRWGQGLYEQADREDGPADDLVRATLLGGPCAAASHLSAAVALGWDVLERPRRPEITVPRTHGSVRVPMSRVYRRALARADIRVVGVLPVTCPERTAIDIAADHPPLHAVAAVDSGLRLRQVTKRQLEAELRGRRTMPRARSAAEVLSLVDPLSGSVPESVARCLFVTAGLPAPICQFTITSDGRQIARVDFAWPHVRLVVEIDGFEWHFSREAFQRDRTRQNDLVLRGWTVLRFTADDVRLRPAMVVEKVAAGLGVER